METPPLTGALAHAPAGRSSNSLFQNRAVASSFLKGLDLMTLVIRRPEGVPVAILMRKLKLPRTSVLRLLATLRQYGFVIKDGHNWRATEQFHHWGARDTDNELKSRYGELIRTVAAEVDELVELAVGEARGVRFIYWEQGTQPITIDPLKSGMYPLHQTAAGKLLLSQRPDLAQGVINPRLQAEIAEARTTGFAWNRRESDPNIMAIATWAAAASSVTPVICVKWPFFRFTEAKAHRALAIVRRELARLPPTLSPSLPRPLESAFQVPLS